MIFNHPGRLLAVSIALMLFGVVMPLLMIIHVVESTFFMNFLSHTASTAGFFLGIISIASSRAKSKRDKDRPDKNHWEK